MDLKPEFKHWTVNSIIFFRSTISYSNIHILHLCTKVIHTQIHIEKTMKSITIFFNFVILKHSILDFVIYFFLRGLPIMRHYFINVSLQN